MNIGVVGAGKMGAGIVRRLLKGGHKCWVFDPDSNAVKALTELGAIAASSLNDLVDQLPLPRVVWVMVPFQVVEGTILNLAELLSNDDIVLDGGNCFYKDDIRRGILLGKKGIKFLDVGTSGGTWGATRGYCLMIGGPKKEFDYLTPIFRSLAPGVGLATRSPGREGPSNTSEEGFVYCGPSGAGHFVKMVHNGIEYGIMQSLAEGFDLLQNASKLALDHNENFNFELPEIAETWRRGSVISSWLLDLTAQALVEDPSLSSFSGQVSDTGMGRWTINAAIELGTPVPVLTASLFSRFRSRLENMFGDKLLSALRNKFGGHVDRF